MSLERGKFGIEYNPRQTEEKSSGLGWLFIVVALAALVSFIWTRVKGNQGQQAEDAANRAETSAVSRSSVAASHAATPQAASNAPPSVLAPEMAGPSYALRPAKIRNLLMRLEEAERSRDIEMAATTIEAIRRLPGSPAADIDDMLARRLGELNLRRLFVSRNVQWVKQVIVKHGNSASRIAKENGSTLASLSRLNGGEVSHLVPGSKLYVMDHPRFNLVIRRRTRTADLSLNGKFFRRYYLQGEIKAKSGVYELPESKRAFWNSAGVSLKSEDRVELETLLPRGTSVLISEM